MWSGPRNISTAMMRSWGSRDDTYVSDEPLYAHYLDATRFEHPGAAEVIATHETDWRNVVAWLTDGIPDGKQIWYQKHMAHHLLDGIDRDWIMSLTNAFLVRDPAPMVASLAKVLPNPVLEETGLPQQWELFQRVADASGTQPPVIRARDVLADPRGLLSSLCSVLEVPFSDQMLSWEPGPRVTDGVWARHWYANVESSTGFEPYVEKDVHVPPRLTSLVRGCESLFERLVQYALKP